MKARMKIARIDKFTPVFNFFSFILFFYYSWCSLLFGCFATYPYADSAYNRLTHLGDALTEIRTLCVYTTSKLAIRPHNIHVRNVLFFTFFVTQWLMYGAFRKR